MSRTKKLSRRQRQKRRQRQAQQSRMIWFGCTTDGQRLCDGEALILAGSEQAMREICQRFLGPDGWRVYPITFEVLFAAPQAQQSYAFDVTVQEAFEAWSQAQGLDAFCRELPPERVERGALFANVGARP